MLARGIAFRELSLALSFIVCLTLTAQIGIEPSPPFTLVPKLRVIDVSSIRPSLEPCPRVYPSSKARSCADASFIDGESNDNPA